MSGSEAKEPEVVFCLACGNSGFSDALDDLYGPGTVTYCYCDVGVKKWKLLEEAELKARQRIIDVGE